MVTTQKETNDNPLKPGYADLPWDELETPVLNKRFDDWKEIRREKEEQIKGVAELHEDLQEVLVTQDEIPRSQGSIPSTSETPKENSQDLLASPTSWLSIPLAPVDEPETLGFHSSPMLEITLEELLGTPVQTLNDLLDQSNISKGTDNSKRQRALFVNSPVTPGTSQDDLAEPSTAADNLKRKRVLFNNSSGAPGTSQDDLAEPITDTDNLKRRRVLFDNSSAVPGPCQDDLAEPITDEFIDLPGVFKQFNYKKKEFNEEMKKGKELGKEEFVKKMEILLNEASTLEARWKVKAEKKQRQLVAERWSSELFPRRMVILKKNILKMTNVIEETLSSMKIRLKEAQPIEKNCKVCFRHFEYEVERVLGHEEERDTKARTNASSVVHKG